MPLLPGLQGAPRAKERLPRSGGRTLPTRWERARRPQSLALAQPWALSRSRPAPGRTVPAGSGPGLAWLPTTRGGGDPGLGGRSAGRAGGSRVRSVRPIDAGSGGPVWTVWRLEAVPSPRPESPNRDRFRRVAEPTLREGSISRGEGMSESGVVRGAVSGMRDEGRTLACHKQDTGTW